MLLLSVFAPAISLERDVSGTTLPVVILGAPVTNRVHFTLGCGIGASP